ncbi:MAG TPA: M20 family metallopeptidase [Atopostipes sp.]|nr:M20 family metallopeptidase [Atopostipes sp.]
MNAVEKVKASVEENIDGYMEIVQALYDNPELGNEEFESMKLLVDYLEQAGFETQSGYVVPTGFLGTYDTKKPGPTIAFMCEYDALPEIGHGCGHNLIAAIGVAAGEALKEVVDDYGGKVLVVGTPAEENFGGKVSMADAGVFDDVDVALMIHPGSQNGVGGRSSALVPLKFEFFGKTAHAAANPWDGVSALDAAVMSYVQINALRQMTKPHTTIHGIIRDGGTAPNVIPDYASIEYYFRAPTMAYAREISEKAINMVEAISEANGTNVEYSEYTCAYDDTVINYKLADVLTEKFGEIGVEIVQPVNEVAGGSTDVGAVSYKCPTIQGNIQIVDEGISLHTREVAEATISPAGREGLVKGAQGIALTALELLENPELLAEIKEEQEETLAELA